MEIILYELPNLYKLLNFRKIYSSIMADKIGNKNIAEKSAWKLTLISRVNQNTKNYNRPLSLMEAQWVHVL